MVARALWSLLAALRAGWCLLPQSGYLHPDEFFQAPEVMAASGASNHITITGYSMLCGNEWYTPKNVKVDTSFKSLGAALYCDTSYTK
ncbi:hypothetical protein TURU_031094 [Turdus rufiventris]|nr:hypothetical protein TURU_031094 [Turdus rufiventris]